MKKTAAIISAAAVLALSGITAFAQQGDNIVEDVVSGAGDVVDGVLSGAEDVVSGVTDGVSEAIPGDSDGPSDDESSDTSDGEISDESSNEESSNEESSDDTSVLPDTEDNTNVPTGVSAFEFAALGAAALGGLGAMALSARKKND